MTEQELRKVAVLARHALERRRERPALAMLTFMKEQLEVYKIANIEPNWGKMFKQSRKIFGENL